MLMFGILFLHDSNTAPELENSLQPIIGDSKRVASQLEGCEDWIDIDNYGEASPNRCPDVQVDTDEGRRRLH